MAVLSPAQIKTYADAAGFKGDVLNDMVGIALAESGGNTTDHTSKPPDDSYGLWQINMLGSMGPTRRKQFGISDNKQLFDPGINAHAAFVIYQSQGLNAWTTYKNGDYLKHMGAVANASLPDVSGDTAATDTATGFSGITAAINAVGNNIFKGFANITGISVAVLLFLAGIGILVANSRGAKKALKTAATVIK